MPSKEQSKRAGAAWEQSTSSDDTDSTTPSPDTPSESIPTDGYPIEEHSLFMDDHDTPWWRMQEAARGEEIVIAGISGRFPESDNIEEFAENLMAGKNLLTEDNRRWEPGFYDLPKRHGKLKDLSRFDAQFFGVTPKQANYMDPQVRLLLEVSYEAIMDAGLNPKSLRGTRTGVFVGCSASETAGSLTQDPETVVGYTLTGCTRSMFANRLSYSLDLRGPSFAVDTACSSSLLALQLAIDAIRQDQCDAALVAGAHLTLLPTSALQFLRLSMLSPNSNSRSFDAEGDGYARGEGVAAILLQKSSNARRCYATVVHAKSNTDGYKEQGITFPSGHRQAQLLEEIYREAAVDPNTVQYVETHGTGTKVGDPQEANAISEVFCSNRGSPLLIGSVKSNMGHAEPASGLASVAKVIIAMEKGVIPPNLHYNEPNPYIPGLVDGRLQVVTEPTPWNGGLVGINSFGFGGSNTHIVLRSKPSAQPPQPIPQAPFPKLVLQAGRTQEAADHMLKAVENNADNAHFHELVADQANVIPNLCPYRGYTLLNREGEASDDLLRDIQKVPTNEKREIWFVYPGMGTQWAGMGQELMVIQQFKDTVLSCSEALRPLGVDPYSLIMKGDDEVFKNTMHCMVCITAIQIALTDILRSLGVTPDGIIGHSTGEMACGYADECLDRRQTMLLAYYRGQTIVTGGLNMDGGMAAVGLTWEEAQKRCVEGVYPACHNGYDSVTVSGNVDKVKEMVDMLKQEEIFAKAVDSSGVPFHSPMMRKIEPEMLKGMSEVITEPKPRTPRWISSCIPEEDWDKPLAQSCSAEYQVHNAMSQVLFYEVLLKIPANAVTVEIAPHSLMQAVLRRTLPANCTNVGLMKARQEKQLEFFLQKLGTLYQAGVNLNIKSLYPAVHGIVPSGTPMIGPLIKWDHNHAWPVVNAKDFSGGGGGAASSCSFTVDPYAPDSKDQYLLDHVIDGRVLFPFTGHMVLAWKALCKIRGLDFGKTPIIMEDVNVYRPTIMSKAVKFDVVILPGEGRFEILEGDSLTASGKISIVEEYKPFFYDDIDKYPPNVTCERVELETADVYKEFLLRGYEYGPHFRGIYRTCNSGDRGTLYWTGNWVTFLDSLLQTALLYERADTLRLPVRMRYLRIDPEKHANAVQETDDLQLINLRNDINTNGCVAGGVETCELVATTVPRRLHASGPLFLERVYFIQHHDDECLGHKDFTETRADMAKYKDLCKAVLARGLKQWKESGELQAMPNAALLLQALDNLPKKVEIDQKYFDACLENQYCTLLQYYNRLFKMERGDEDQAAFIANVTNWACNALPTLDIDKLWTGSFMQRPLKPLLDMSMENVAGHFSKFVWVEPQDVGTLKMVTELQLTHPLVEIEHIIISPDVENLDQQVIEEFGKGLKLDLESADLPTSETYKNLDVVVCDKSLSRRIDIPRFLEKMKGMMRDDGYALIAEMTSDFELAFANQGLLGSDLPAAGDGARIYGAYMTHKQWLATFEGAGFQVVGHQADAALMSTLYLIHKIPTVPREPHFINVSDVDKFDWIEPLQKAIEDRLGEPDDKTIWVIDNEIRDNGTVGLALCLREEDVKFHRFRSIMDVSLKVRDGPAVLTMESEIVQKLISEDLHANNWRDGQNGSFRHIVVKEDQMHAYKQTEHAFINTRVKGDLSSLCWVESSTQYWDALPRKPNDTREICAIYYASVNFRDVMLATGRLPPDAIPGQFADRDCLLGMEFAGRMKNSGRRVMGILPAQALATNVVVDSEFSWEVPDTWSLEQAATVPVVYCTAYYALLIRGRLRRGDRVLIHSGSGGVGQAAISVALEMGCEVYTTVGTDEKKAFLKKRFPQLQDKHFSNSRSTEFEWDIRQATKGKGVDMVLNSLSEDKLQASLRCLSQHGRFLEIGKFDLSNNTPLGMSLFLKNITFHGILLDALMDGKNQDWLDVAKMLQDGIKKGVVTPLPATCFTSNEVEEAFRYMASGKHIGKVLVQIRTEEKAKVCVPTPITVRAICRTLCHPQHVYLITGGLGGFGLEVAQWLINRGAKKLVLTSRHGIRTGYQARCIYFWRRTGISILVSTLNIAVEDEARRLIKQCQEMGTLGGLFHLAMVLRDCLFENQFAQNFKDAAAAKYWGTKYLDKATRDMCDDHLRWFVAFSSITSGRGNAGQTNYGWANSTMERVIEMRQADGLPGIAIQWGAIGDVGVVLENMGDNSTVIGGTLPQRIPSCLQTLDSFLSWEHPIVSSYIRADMHKKGSGGGHGDVIMAIAHILGVSDISQLDMNANLGDLGLDSLMGVEIKQALERDFDIVLSMKDIRILTLEKLKEMADAGGGAAARQIARDNSAERDDTPEVSMEELEMQMQSLFKLRIDLNDLLTTEKLVKMNEVPDDAGPMTFFLHSIEGISTPLSRLGSLLPFPCYCFQYTPGCPSDSIENMATFYIDVLKKKQPQGPYRLVGYSYGACIAFEMAGRLQSEDINSVKSLILLDGSHHYMKTYRNVYRRTFGMTGEAIANNPIFEAEIMCAFILRFANIDYKTFRNELLQAPNWKGRVQKVVDVAMTTGMFHNPETVGYTCEQLRNRFLCADKYDPKHKFEGTISLIRAEQTAGRVADVGNDYGISEVSSDSQVYVVEGDHDWIVQGDSSPKTAEIIQKIIQPSS